MVIFSFEENLSNGVGPCLTYLRLKNKWVSSTLWILIKNYKGSYNVKLIDIMVDFSSYHGNSEAFSTRVSCGNLLLEAYLNWRFNVLSWKKACDVEFVVFRRSLSLEVRFIWASMYLARKCSLRTLFFPSPSEDETAILLGRTHDLLPLCSEAPLYLFSLSRSLSAAVRGGYSGCFIWCLYCVLYENKERIFSSLTI